jgi:hypothetical protein
MQGVTTSCTSPSRSKRCSICWIAIGRCNFSLNPLLRKSRLAQSPLRPAQMSLALQKQLRMALAGLDTETPTHSIDMIRAIDPGLGDSLAAPAEAYDYEKVLAVLPARDTVKAEADG